MASNFTFDFSDRDIQAEVDDDDGKYSAGHEASSASKDRLEITTDGITPKSLKLETILATFPSEIRYTILKVNGSNDINYFLPRRDLSDVKAQVKIEGNGSLGSLLSGCDDLVTQKYEGGFKTWESSIDLAELLSRSYATTTDHGFPDYECCIEFGCGTALPSSILFHQTLLRNRPKEFILTDYNEEVLSHVTLPNLFLTWLLVTREDPTAVYPEQNPEATVQVVIPSRSLLSSFLEDLKRRGIILKLISGSWNPPQRIATLMDLDVKLRTLIISSETIYSPSAAQSLADLIHWTFSLVSNSYGIISGKKEYFGVGGGINYFLGIVDRRLLEVNQLPIPTTKADDGVERSILVVKPPVPVIKVM